MKQLRFFLTTALFALVVMACSGQKRTEDKTKNQTAGEAATTLPADKGKALIVFFSHTGENYAVGHITVGNTKIVADYIKEATGADQFEIVPERSYQMPYSELIKVAKQETEKNVKPAFRGEVEKIDEYQTIFIGGPIWWGTYPQVMFTFFDRYDLNGKTIIPFTTHEGSGLGSTVRDLRRLYPKADVKAGFAIQGRKVRTSKDEVLQWLKGLGY